MQTKPKTISGAFNKFFSTNAKDIANKFILTNKSRKDYLNFSVVNSFFPTPYKRRRSKINDKSTLLNQ